jgi:hypothetical protein
VLTLHHWADWRAGCAELRRVARERVVVFSWDPAFAGRMWLGPEYFPDLVHDDVAGFPTLAEQAYLDPAVRAGISTLAKRSDDELAAGLAHLRADIESGAWARRHADLLALDELDLGYRLLVGAP